jgi:hypothetical protein
LNEISKEGRESETLASFFGLGRAFVKVLVECGEGKKIRKDPWFSEGR